MSDEKPIWGHEAATHFANALVFAATAPVNDRKWHQHLANNYAVAMVDALGRAVDEAIAAKQRTYGPFPARDENELALQKIRDAVQANSGEATLAAVRRVIAERNRWVEYYHVVNRELLALQEALRKGVNP